MPIADLKAGRFHFHDSDGDGPALVFAHGFLMDHEMWELQVAELNSDYRCIVWDQRSHGATEVGGRTTYWDSANDELALLDELGIDDFVHIGMSQGGFIGLRVALTAPKRVRGLVFIDSQAGIEDPTMLPMYQSLLTAWVAREDRAGIAATVAQIILGPNVDQEYWASKWLSTDPDLEAMFDTLTSREDLHHRLSEIRCPALVVHGIEDVAIPMEKAQKLADGLPNADGVVKIERAGHSSNLADPLTVNAAIREFLKTF